MFSIKLILSALAIAGASSIGTFAVIESRSHECDLVQIMKDERSAQKAAVRKDLDAFAEAIAKTPKFDDGRK